MKFLKALLFSALLLTIPQFLKRDFKIPPTLERIPFNPAWETAPPDSQVLSILKQPFSYLTHGNQSTIFLSQNGQYVLKLFRYTRSPFPFIEWIKSRIAKCKQKKPKNDLFTKANKTFTAAHLAYTKAQRYTQVLFCHLNLTENKLPIAQLQAGRLYRLPLDRYRFVLQKRVDPFKETLLSAKNNPEQMRHLIDSLVDLLIERSALGIRNSDPNLGPNFGFLNGQAVEIDFGNYRKAPQTAAEIGRYLTRFEHWLQKNAPEHLDYLKNLHRNTLISYDPAE